MEIILLKDENMVNLLKSKLIVLYGINNLGKTTQAKMLVERLNFEGCKVEYLKYPIYNLKPSGEIINGYLREKNPYNLSPREAQIIYTINRTQYENELIKKLESGINIVAEDYIGTGLAWGIGAGVNEKFLKHINSHLLQPNIAFLFDGERFKESLENNHKHETDDELIEKVRWTHLRLGREFGWIKINANLSIDEIHSQIWNELQSVFNQDKTAESCLTASQAVKQLNSNFSDEIPARTAQVDNTESEQSDLTNAGVAGSDLKNESNRKSEIKNLKLHIERLSPIAKLPSRAHQCDAGLDLFAADYYSIFPGEQAIIKTGVKMAIPDGCAGFIWDKSGIAKNSMHSLAGIIDAGFRGELTVNLINLSQDIYNISPGQKVAQIIIQKIELPEIVEKKISDKTDRGEGCLGSTGLY